MRKLSSIFALVVMAIAALPINSASANGTLSQGDWTITYPDFSAFATDQTWSFHIKTSGTNSIQSGDSLDLNIYTASNQLIAFDSYLHLGDETDQVTLDLIVDRSAIEKADLTKPLRAQLVVDRDYDSELDGGTFNFSIPTTTFPKRPADLAGYLKMETSFLKPISFPKDCQDIFFSYTVTDPYLDIDEINFDLLDSSGRSVASAYAYGVRSATKQEKLSLCPYSITDGSTPLKFQIEIQFDSSLNKAPLRAEFPFAMASKYAESDALVTKMPKLCQKGGTIKSSKGACPAGYKSLNFATPSTVQWNTLTRSSNSLKGKNFLIYGCVIQFDTNTGGNKFRAYALPGPADRYYTGANSIFAGSAKSLLKLSEDDAFAAKVTVLGSVTYTTLGGRTSVPSFLIRDFVRIGKC